ncbi:HTH-type transcriptional regulator / antitoxin HigA [Variovorax sp. OK605]|uniref:ImmA/IrrE family metallo-endopeptidase n=1 Tax=Variovorax sp. OK605 TaxID=1855317 RepID=UPI0008EC6A84|nr:ImmA/IrrE family metallo-endopeptidase [Variovorax sp. OK605]SFP46568.1 HTH-type transcriptional regulator / antitoxin HigA [Variovorax sp. OK605]
MELRVIKDEVQYAALLDEAKEIALADPSKGSPSAERLEVISLLLENYESTRFLLERPDPIDAVVYRMAELGLKQKDFADIIGSRSRASEVLARKRPLTLEMIRSIHERLYIPAELLIGQSREVGVTVEEDWTLFPLKEMKKRGWFENEEGKTGEQLIKSFFSRTSSNSAPVMLRRSLAGDSGASDSHALYAWIARVLIRARELKRSDIRYVSGSITDEFLRQLSKLSGSEQGPLLAREFLAMKGVVLVVEPHLPKTHLDGAAMLDEDGTPVIGMTLRHDRVDNFWFTLMHELVHVQRHLGKGTAFVDDSESAGRDKTETEADIFAAEAFIPRQIWKSSDAYRLKRADSVKALASSLMIHPAIVAGRIRRETNNYRILKEFVTAGGLRELFGLHS